MRPTPPWTSARLGSAWRSAPGSATISSDDSPPRPWWLDGVDVKALRIDTRRATSQTLIVNVRGEDRRFIHSVGPTSASLASDLDAVLEPSAPGAAHRLFPDSSRARRPGPCRAFAAARAAGTRTLLDVATPGPGNYLDPLRVVLPHTDIFVPNTDEAALILGEDDPIRQALTFHDMGARRVVITLASAGLISVSDEQRLRLGTYAVDFVDGSGGGDAFDAGYIVGLLEIDPNSTA